MCECFTCRHHDQPELCAAYFEGYVKACDWFLTWAKCHNIQPGSIADDDLPGIVAQMKCNRDESQCLLEEAKEMINDRKAKDNSNG